MKEIRRINKRRKAVVQSLAAVRTATEELKAKYEKLRADHDALKALAHRFMGGFMNNCFKFSRK